MSREIQTDILAFLSMYTLNSSILIVKFIIVSLVNRGLRGKNQQVTLSRSVLPFKAVKLTHNFDYLIGNNFGGNALHNLKICLKGVHLGKIIPMLR